MTPNQTAGAAGPCRRTAASLTATLILLLFGAGVAAAQQTAPADPRDPRIGLRAGLFDAEQAAHNMELVSNTPRPPRFFDAAAPGAVNYWNSDLAFRDDLLFLGNFNGFQIYDISNPREPRLRLEFVCPGGQGDPSVYGNLLFISVEEPRGRVDCGPQGVTEPASPERFRGVRIFDVSNVEQPRQVAAVQTCRGSHTHTLLVSPTDTANVYVYVSGTGPVRPAEELEGCSGLPPEQDPQTALFRIEVIRVPLAAPQQAQVVSTPRLFADAETGNIAGLWRGGGHGEGTQQTAETSRCHDITVYPAIGLAAGACSGNGILLDISDPANPLRIHEVIDPNFAFFHSATFNNDGTKVIFTDEWGGGTAPRCRDTDRPEWGANAIFDIVDRRMRHASYYKIAAPQTPQENCVAHNGSLVPVPGRDIKVQGWYQGGVSVFDFTDSANPVEIAFFDRGPIDADQFVIGGHWSAYWYNGYIYASEMARGLDVFQLTSSELLSQNEIDAARLVRFEKFNAQHQPRITWPAHPTVARAYVDQLVRTGGIQRSRAERVRDDLNRLERATNAQTRRAAAARLDAVAAQLDADLRLAERGNRTMDVTRLRALAATVRELATGAR